MEEQPDLSTKIEYNNIHIFSNPKFFPHLIKKGQ